MEDEKINDQDHKDYEMSLLASEQVLLTINKASQPDRALFWTCVQLMHTLLTSSKKPEEIKARFETALDTVSEKLNGGSDD